MDALIGTADFSPAEWERAASGRTPDEYRENAQATLDVLQRIRDALGVPVYITNSWRSVDANARIKGSARNSQHMTGEGVDFVVPSLTKREVAAQLDAAESAGDLGPYHQLIYYLTDAHYHLGTGDGQTKLVLISPHVYVPYLGPDTLGAANSIADWIRVGGTDDAPTLAARDAEPSALPWGLIAAGVAVLLLVSSFRDL